jgi:hypothetical protein
MLRINFKKYFFNIFNLILKIFYDLIIIENQLILIYYDRVGLKEDGPK